MYTLSQFGETALPVYMTDYDNSTVPAQLAFVETTAGVFDGNGDGRSRQAFPLAISYKATVAQDTLSANKTTLDGLRKLVGTRAFLYRYADNNSTIVHRCQARLVSLNQQRPYDNRNVIHEITLNFQQLSPWLGTTNGTGWNFDSGYVFDGFRYFDEGVTPTTLSLATTLITVTNNGNYPAYDSIVTVTAGSEALESLTVWNTTTNCRWYWAGTVNPAAELQINTGACTVTINGVDDYNHFTLDDPFIATSIGWNLRRGTTISPCCALAAVTIARFLLFFRIRGLKNLWQILHQLQPARRLTLPWLMRRSTN